jgi:hypothetical protein
MWGADAAISGDFRTRRLEEVTARKALVQHLCDQVAAMQERINRLADALEARHKADAEREERERLFEEEPLAEPPGTAVADVPALIGQFLSVSRSAICHREPAKCGRKHRHGNGRAFAAGRLHTALAQFIEHHQCNAL